MALLLALFLCVCFYNVRIRKTETQDNLNLDHSSSLKGMCAISVVLHHLGLLVFQITSLTYTNFFNSYLGDIAVGIFFFLSGFGLTLQLKKHGSKYLKKVLFGKTLLLYVEFVLINLVYYLVPFSGGGFVRFRNFRTQLV